MLRAVIFDFNGIIIDDEPIHFELFQRVLSQEGIGLTKEDYYTRYLGFDDRGAFLTAYRDHGRELTDDQLARLVERKSIYYQEAIRNNVAVFPGVKTLVRSLANKLALAIASGALRHEIETILCTIGLRDCFRTIVSAEDVRAGKPEPEIFLKALAQLNQLQGDGLPINAHECVVIEDSREGIRGARRAGLKCLAITNSHSVDQLKEATVVVGSLEEVTLPFLEKLVR